MYSAKQELWVGLFVIMGVVSLVFTAFQVSGMSDLFSRPGYSVMIQFDNIGSLRARAPVSASGVVVGRVEATGYDPENFQAWARIVIESQYKFPIDSLASIHTSGLLGEQYVSLDPGVEEQLLQPGDYIYNSESALVLENLISSIVGALVDDE